MKKEKMVKVELNLENDLLLELCLLAHEQDMTLNAFVNKILREYVNKVGKNDKK